MDHLVNRGLACLTVLDVSEAALDRARTRLGALGKAVTWLRADVTGDWRSNLVDIWHDRATFHFLTDPAERALYLKHLTSTVKPGGHVIVATFAADGPERCSGLPVMRYSAEALAREFRDFATPLRTVAERHVTPTGGVQAFSYSLMQMRG